jgi:hypothetical protein
MGCVQNASGDGIAFIQYRIRHVYDGQGAFYYK